MCDRAPGAAQRRAPMLQRSNRRLDRRPGLPLMSRFPVRETGCCTAKTAVCAPSGGATSVSGDSLECGRCCSESRLSTRSKPWSDAPTRIASTQFRSPAVHRRDRATAASFHSATQRRCHATDGCGNRHPLPAGRRRRVRLRLSGRRGPQHLRRALQAGQGQARAGAPRAGRRARGRRLFALVARRSASRW